MQSKKIQNKNYFHLIKDVFSLLRNNERKKSLELLIIIFFLGVFELLGIFSIFPFVAILSDTRIIETNFYLKQFFNFFGFEKKDNFLIFLGILVSLIVILNIFLKFFTECLIVKFSAFINSEMSCRLLKKYLNNEYTFFLERHSAELNKSILNEVSVVSNTMILQLLILLTNSLISILIVLMIIIIYPTIGMITFIVIGSTYFLIFRYFKKLIYGLGDLRKEVVRERFKLSQETFDGVKNIKIMNLEEISISNFKKPTDKMIFINTRQKAYKILPGLIVQGLIFLGLMTILIFLLTTSGIKSINEILPTIVLFALSASRVQTAIHNIYSALANIKFAEPIFYSIFDDLTKGKKYLNNFTKQKKIQALRLKQKISLNNVTFKYKYTQKNIIKNVNLSILSGSKNIIIGKTGSGKSSLLDILLGFLNPTKGSLTIDDKKLTKTTIKKWHKNIGYVSQSIFLKDDTIASNIALGLEPNEIDLNRVYECSKIANLHDFISRNLKEKYNTIIGDKGIKLSGGQRQRISIARAIYNNPQILIFDEATSSLDSITEKIIINSMKNLFKDKTIIFVTHRTSLIKNFDKLIIVNNERVLERKITNDLINKKELNHYLNLLSLN